MINLIALALELNIFFRFDTLKCTTQFLFCEQTMLCVQNEQDIACYDQFIESKVTFTLHKGKILNKIHIQHMISSFFCFIIIFLANFVEFFTAKLHETKIDFRHVTNGHAKTRFSMHIFLFFSNIIKPTALPLLMLLLLL